MFRRSSKRKSAKPSRGFRDRMRRHSMLEQLETRQLLAAAPLGATWKDTGEYLLGKVAVQVVFFESNGQLDPQSQNWTPAEIDSEIEKVKEGVNWWGDLLDTLNSVHELEFVFDTTFAEQPFETRYEPIDRPSTDPVHGHHLYISEFLAAQGFTGASSLEDAVWEYNHALRLREEADWGFTIFVVDASDDPDGLFNGGLPGAFALSGGLYMVVPTSRSASTVAHEMGHIFWAFDEYPGGSPYQAKRGYYDTQNFNATDNHPDISQQENSIMLGGAPLAEAYDDLTSPASTLALVGWQDSDGDGVFDVLDVPLDLNVVGSFDSSSSTYRLQGTAQAVALPNLNSYGEHPSITGTNSDITLNRISQLQYSLDDGPWVTAASPDQQVVDVDLTITLASPFETIRWRAVDAATGITSNLVEGTRTTPAMSVSSHRGLSFLDDNANGQRDLGESALATTEVVVRRADNEAMFGGVVDAADLDGVVENLDGVTLTLEVPEMEIGPEYDDQLRALNSSAAGNRNVFFAQEIDNGIEGAARERWYERKFIANFDQAVGQVSVDVIGLNDESYARVEALDEHGNLVTRVTEIVRFRDVATLVVQDPTSSIRSIRAFGLGHTVTGIAVSRVEFGFVTTTTIDATGAWSLPNLPDGQYVAELTPQRLIHQYDQSEIPFSVVGGVSDFVAAAAQVVDSPRHNLVIAEDANGDGIVTARDALVIINDITRFDTRILGPDETTGFDVDVNNDGSATALDALLVINSLNRQPPVEGELVFAASTPETASQPADGNEQATDQAIGAIFGQGEANHDTTAHPLARLPEPEQFQLLDSAGQDTPDESNSTFGADRKGMPSVGAVIAAKTPVFSVFSIDSQPDSHQTKSESEVNARDLAQSFQPFQSELQEPLA